MTDHLRRPAPDASRLPAPDVSRLPAPDVAFRPAADAASRAVPDLSHRLAPGVTFRPAVIADAPSFAATLTRNRAYLRRWEPVRPESFYTVEGQAARLTALLADRDAGRAMPWVLADADDRVIGAFTLSGVERGPFRNARLGYWVDEGHTGRGLATAAVGAVCEAARDRLGLHRVEAATVTDNAPSQRVLAKAGFERIGTAPGYLHISGRWRDHHLFQRLLHDDAPAA